MPRLPTPIVEVTYNQGTPLPDCLRASLAFAKGLSCGVRFPIGNLEYIVWPWMSVEQALELWDPVTAGLIKEQIEAHSRA